MQINIWRVMANNVANFECANSEQNSFIGKLSDKIMSVNMQFAFETFPISLNFKCWAVLRFWQIKKIAQKKVIR